MLKGAGLERNFGRVRILRRCQVLNKNNCCTMCYGLGEIVGEGSTYGVQTILFNGILCAGNGGIMTYVIGEMWKVIGTSMVSDNTFNKALVNASKRSRVINCLRFRKGSGTSGK